MTAQVIASLSTFFMCVSAYQSFPVVVKLYCIIALKPLRSMTTYRWRVDATVSCELFDQLNHVNGWHDSVDSRRCTKFRFRSFDVHKLLARYCQLVSFTLRIDDWNSLAFDCKLALLLGDSLLCHSRTMLHIYAFPIFFMYMTVFFQKNKKDSKETEEE